MSTPFFRTTSNEVEVTDPEAVEEILEDYVLRPQEVESIFNGETICIRTPDMPNHGFYVDRVKDNEVIEDQARELYERLSEYLTEPLKINTVQTDGVGNSNITLTVNPDGEINTENHNPAV